MTCRIAGIACLTILLASACDGHERDPQPTSIQVGPISGTLEVDHEPVITELADGRVAAILGRAGPVVLHDFSSATSDTIGRRGFGPNEFSAPYALRLWSDSLVGVFDALVRRLTLVRVSGVIDSLIAFPSGVSSGMPLADTCGSWWFDTPSSAADSALLLRAKDGSALPDSIARLHDPPLYRIELGNVMLQLIPEYQTKDIWGLGPDCSAWIARGQSNQLDIVRGTVVERGVPLPYATLRTRPEDLRRHLGLPAFAPIDTLPRRMAETKAPFQDVRVAGDGSAWFWLNQPAGYTSELYAVIVRRRALPVQVSLPGSRKLLAVGANHLYAVGVDLDGSMKLERYPRPRPTVP